MVRRQFLLVVVALLAVGLLPANSALALPHFKTCVPAAGWSGCAEATGTVNEDSVDVGASAETGQEGDSSDEETSPDSNPVVVLSPRDPRLGSEETLQNDNRPGTACWDAPDVCNPSLVISLSDIASFKASIPVLAQMQPSGWALKNLPMNLVAQASVEEISGELLGFPASVRFTPVSYLWDYGDGTTGTSITGGASWEALGVPELTKTATSHVYRERGEYAVTVSVVLSAEYRFAGQPWRPIAGTLQIDGAASPVSVKTVRTVLVRGTCLQYPNDPGC